MNAKTPTVLSVLIMCAAFVLTEACSPTYYSSHHGDTGSRASETRNGVDLERIYEQLRGESTSKRDRTLHVTSNLSGGYDIEDASGLKQGELDRRPGGGFTIENEIGQKIGELEPNPGGGYDIENQFDRDVGDVEPNSRGGYDIEDPYGRDVKQARPNLQGGYELEDQKP